MAGMWSELTCIDKPRDQEPQACHTWLKMTHSPRGNDTNEVKTDGILDSYENHRNRRAIRTIGVERNSRSCPLAIRVEHECMLH
jgi:hypothetical protein